MKVRPNSGAASAVAAATLLVFASSTPSTATGTGGGAVDAATVEPQISESYEVFDDVTVNTALWKNFHATVEECMNRQGWEYKKPAVPTWWEKSIDADGPTGTFDDSFVELPYPNGEPQTVGPTTVEYLEALRGNVTTDDNGSREYLAHDGMNDPYYGSAPEDTDGCEAYARATVISPAIEAGHDLVDAVAAELADDLPEDALIDPDAIASAVMDDPVLSSELDNVIADNEEVLLDASGNFGR